MVIPIIVGALGTVPKEMERDWKSVEESRPSRPQHLLKPVTILRRILESSENMMSLDL